MKKKFFLVLVLVTVAILLCGCASKQEPEEIPTIQQDPLAVPTPAPVPTQLPYNPLDEEDEGSYVPGAVYDEYGNIKAMYAGATPIPLDPVDMPTPTPKPSLAFGYSPMTFNNLGIKFEAPQGWYVDTQDPNAVRLIDPNTYDNVQASLYVSITSVSSDYKLSNVKQTLSETLSDLSRSYATWEIRQAASRTLLKKDGYYNNYTGVMVDGTEVRGRVMIALLDNDRIITVILTAPGGYNESYLNVLTHFRDTLRAL